MSGPLIERSRLCFCSLARCYELAAPHQSPKVLQHSLTVSGAVGLRNDEGQEERCNPFPSERSTRCSNINSISRSLCINIVRCPIRVHFSNEILYFTALSCTRGDRKLRKDVAINGITTSVTEPGERSPPSSCKAPVLNVLIAEPVAICPNDQQHLTNQPFSVLLHIILLYEPRCILLRLSYHHTLHAEVVAPAAFCKEIFKWLLLDQPG